MGISQHNSINKTIQASYYKPGATRARIQQLESTKLAEAIVSEYKHKVQVCLKKASTNTTDRKGEASCLGTSELLLVVGYLHVVIGTSGVLLLLGSII